MIPGRSHALRQKSRSSAKNGHVRGKNLQELIQASKLSLLGQLAAGIAHELRNPLAVLRLECDELGRKIETLSAEERPGWAVHCDAINRNIVRMLDIVEGIRSMSAKPSESFAKLNIHDVLKEAERWSRHLLKPAEIRLDIEARAANPHFYGNKTQMEQVFLNLIRNAVDAIRSSGMGSSIRATTRSLNGRIFIDVRDDGPGVHARDLPLLFDPFFTAKKGGEGVGLGLSIVAQIVQEHGGTIAADSRHGKGACFRISLPNDRRRTAREAGA